METYRIKLIGVFTKTTAKMELTQDLIEFDHLKKIMDDKKIIKHSIDGITHNMMIESIEVI